MPDTDDIDYVLLRDEPKIIEEEYHRNSYTYLIWGIMGSRRIAHVLLSEPPDCQIITAYWPDIQPEKDPSRKTK